LLGDGKARTIFLSTPITKPSQGEFMFNKLTIQSIVRVLSSGSR
jgi:hypothetical protein